MLAGPDNLRLIVLSADGGMVIAAFRQHTLLLLEDCPYR
jgi:hypothetical protein